MTPQEFSLLYKVHMPVAVFSAFTQAIRRDKGSNVIFKFLKVIFFSRLLLERVDLNLQQK